MDLEKAAEAHFAERGIDPSVDPSEGMTTLPCRIDIYGVLFYAYVEVTFTDLDGKTHKFKGDSGGVGVGTISGAGVIYYSDLSKLLGTKTFGVAFVSDEGGTAMVTWGSNGNANIAGIGDGMGAFGGSGKWS